MPDHRPVSQHDIAARLGLGQKTVSRVFGGGPVSAATRERVLRAASELGYRPNAGARAMRTGRTGTVVLLQSTRPSASNLPGEVLAGICDALAAGDANLMVARFDDARLLETGALPKALRELTGDGVLVNYDTDAPPALPNVLRAAGLPAVWLNSLRSHDAVRPDDRAAGAALARHLLAAGHRSLAWLDLHLAWTEMRHYSREHRRDGFLEAARAAGATAVAWQPEAMPADPAAWLLDRMAAATAFGCYGEHEFHAILRACALSGRRVPEDVAVAGVLCGPLIGMPVDSVGFDLHALGATAVGMLLDRIAGAGRRPAVCLPPILTSGGTVAAPSGVRP